MRPLTSADLLSIEEYERQREAFRRHIIALKQRRRISVGEHVTLVFENRETIQFQVQEMVRVERIVDPKKIQEELDVYNAMLPADGELSASFLIEITDDARLQALLDAFKGIDRGRTVALTAGAHRVYGDFERGHSSEEKISAVHFVKFRPEAPFIEALASGDQPVTVRVDHGPVHEEAAVTEEMRREWLADLDRQDIVKGQR